ncbi:MAG: hypothetical protein LBR65_01305 [Culturomica sp.]|jgi:hypothetical protein|nr:hypothetical protein [Culturomica sp.]
MEERIKVSVKDPILSDGRYISEDLFDRSELLQLQCALHPELLPYVELSMGEYDSIKDKMSVRPVMIQVLAYYGNPSYYSVMPQPIFDALEAATLNSEDFALVDKTQFDKMIESYIQKISAV